MSSGMPSSHVLSRYTDPVPRSRTHPGPKAREPAVHKPRCSRHVAGIALTPEHEEVDALRLHLGEHAGAARKSQGNIVGKNFG